jgi:hypothetical protein
LVDREFAVIADRAPADRAGGAAVAELKSARELDRGGASVGILAAEDVEAAGDKRERPADRA